MRRSSIGDPEAAETIVHMLAVQVQRQPTAPAIVSGEEILSYADLWEQAGSIAAQLQDLGAGPDRIVAVLGDRSPNLVVAIVGVLRSGSAYLPLEPSYPRARLDLMMRECRAIAVVADPSLVAEASRLGVAVTSASDASPKSNPAVGATPDSLAYVLYTSGSTGRPKGVMIEHRALLNRLTWMTRQFRAHRRDIVLLKTPLSFDVSVWECLWPLVNGSLLAILEPQAQIDPRAVQYAIDKYQVSIAHFVPSMLKAFCDALPSNACPSLRIVVASGEVLPPAVAATLFSKTRARLYNLYGPTEAAIDVTYWECAAEALDQTIPIGRAIDNVEVFVVDEQLIEVPHGAVGEIAIAGVCLARGYIGQDDLTAQRFVTMTRSDGTTRRAYRSGDLGRQDPDGVTEYLGRADRQIKLRGYRIEPGEIEGTLLLHPGVAQAVVIASAGKLLACIVPSPTDAPSTTVLEAELSRSLLATLPRFMLPRLLFFDAFPITANGKIDSSALEELADRKARIRHSSPA